MTIRLPLVATGLVATLALAGCSTGPTDASGSGGAGSGTSASPAAGGAEPGAFPVTIEHAFGETTIEEEPRRVVTVGWSDADHVVDLGVVPVGVPAITWGGNEQQSTDWFDAALAELGGAEPTRYDDTDGVPVDEIAQLTPDLILATNSGLTKAEYTRLSKVADVVAYPGEAWGTPWDTSLEMIGEALGRSDRAAELEAETDEAIAGVADRYPALAGTSAAWAWFTPNDTSTVGLYTGLDNRPRMLRTFGLENPGIVERLSRDSRAFSANVSAEKADEVDADVLIYYAEGAPTPEELAADPLFGRMPAVRAGAVVAAADNTVSQTMSSPTTLSIPVAVDEFLPLVEEAAQKAQRGDG